MTDTPLTALLREGFDPLALPAACWIRLAIEEEQDDFRDVIAAVTSGGQRDAMIRRLRNEHTARRSHDPQHDERAFDVFTEAEALSWAREVARLGDPVFVFEEGCPDFRIGDQLWLEAKAIRESDFERAEIARLELEQNFAETGILIRGLRVLDPLPDAVLLKLDEKLDDSVRKWERQGNTGALITFFDMNLDWGVSFRDAPVKLSAWGEAAARRTNSRVVIAWMDRHDWRNPLVDVGE